MSTIRQPARDLPVVAAYDVVVVGGGIAGVAAAVAAARNGASVGLVERYCALGGLATLGNVIVYLPLCDGRGRQVMAGLPEELLHLSVADLPEDRPAARFRRPPECWKPGGDPARRAAERYSAEFNPASYLLALEKLVLDAGVTLLYDTRFCAVRRDGYRITHVVVENKSGRSALAARTVVDATGDADVCFVAGEPTESLDSNVPAAWFYTLAGADLQLHQLSNPYSPTGEKTDGDGLFFRGDSAGQVTAQIIQSRALLRDRLAELRAACPGRDVQPLMPATIACFRMTRRLDASVVLTTGDEHRWFDDAVGLSGHWWRPGPVYAIPLRALAAPGTVNLLAAGRCISARGGAWEALRPIPTCALTGEAAGTAAALAAAGTDGDLSRLDVPALQDRLRANGALLDPALVTPA
jgi:glycine/D-amino acid oxidase-like deaminating enzyme